MEARRRKRALELAASYVDDAYAGFLEHGFKRPSLQRLSANLSLLRTTMLAILLLLAFFERPAWCFQSSCGDPQVRLLRSRASAHTQ